MNCSLYCIPSYGQVYNVKHWHTCQCSELLWLLPARARIFPFDSASGGVCVCERGRERVPLTEKMSSPNSMNPILRDVNIFREHLALSVFSYALFLPCLLLHHSHVLGGNIGLNSLSLTPILLVWREVQKKQHWKKLLQKLEAPLAGSCTSVQQYDDSFSCYLPWKSFGPLDNTLPLFSLSSQNCSRTWKEKAGQHASLSSREQGCSDNINLKTCWMHFGILDWSSSIQEKTPKH